MKEQLNKIKDEIFKALEKVNDPAGLKELEVKYLGRKSEFNRILKSIGGLEDEQKRVLGKEANEIKKQIIEKIESARKNLGLSRPQAEDADPTLPGKKMEGGHLHPLTLIQRELQDIFSSMGFMVLEGPELESDFYNFEALNIPDYHPARDMQDTFYIDQKGEQGGHKLVMRTHTSPVQVRAMRKHGAPLRCVVPGRVFRAEATDATHEHTFDQLEGLMIDKGISIANLLAVMQEFFTGVFGKKVELRTRPGYFPFVEPGIEIDVKCTICQGAKCPSCKHSGWLEMLGAGMVHPKVLECGGIDPQEYTGFAFGIGLPRLVMMKYGINDIRLFTGGDLRFLEQF